MRKNVFGELYSSAEDVLIPLLRELENTNFVNILPNTETKYGFTKDGKINRKGLYLIYKEENLIYVGMSRSSIQYRISRFFAGARGTDRHDESHPAGQKYSKNFSNFDNLSMKTVDFDFSSLPVGLTVENVERELIFQLRPLLNIQIYKSRFVSSAVLKLKA